jgi:hypothetical protein
MDNSRRLRTQTREQMLSPQIQIASKHQLPTLTDETSDESKSIRLSYGRAWALYWTPYGKVFFKEGHDDGWRNYAVCFDQQKSALVIMTNRENGEGISKDVLGDAAAAERHVHADRVGRIRTIRQAAFRARRSNRTNRLRWTGKVWTGMSAVTGYRRTSS